MALYNFQKSGRRGLPAIFVKKNSSNIKLFYSFCFALTIFILKLFMLFLKKGFSAADSQQHFLPSRMLRSALRMKRYALVFFTEEIIHGVCPTSAIVVGLAAPGQDVIVWWDKKHPSTKARIVKLGGKTIILYFFSHYFTSIVKSINCL